MTPKHFLYHIIYIVCLALLLAFPKQTHARQTETDSVRLSLITCGAGNEIYALFGHTAIRYEDPSRDIDAVFNYGLFDFNTPNFALRFALGETDYLLGVSSYEHFIRSYELEGREVWQQPLNLTPTEEERLVQQLKTNLLPENRIYRYNFLYDNCATRPRDQVERALLRPLHYADDMTDTDIGVTFRDVVRQFTAGHPWASFGIDFCLGCEADEPINRRQMMFAPLYTMEFMSKAQIDDGEGHLSPLLGEVRQLVFVSPDKRHASHGITPLGASLLLLAVVLAATLYGVRRGKSLWGIDLVLFGAAGVAGCISAFLVCCSQHPTVGSNYLLAVFHPLHLVWLPVIIYKSIRGLRSRYMVLNFVVLTLFILLWGVIPQKFDWAVLPLALSLLIRSWGHLALFRHTRWICGTPFIHQQTRKQQKQQ